MTDKTSAVLVFRFGTTRFALPAEIVEEVAEWRTLAPLPQAPVAILGVACIQARMFTVLDPHCLFDDAPQGWNESSPALIVALRGDEQLALALDAQEGSIQLDEEPIAASPAGDGNLVLATFVHDGETINIINPDNLFPIAIRGRERRRRRF
jgi:chemotaxis signal transduction protein